MNAAQAPLPEPEGKPGPSGAPTFHIAADSLGVNPLGQLNLHFFAPPSHTAQNSPAHAGQADALMGFWGDESMMLPLTPTSERIFNGTHGPQPASSEPLLLPGFSPRAFGGQEGHPTFSLPPDYQETFSSVQQGPRSYASGPSRLQHLGFAMPDVPDDSQHTAYPGQVHLEAPSALPRRYSQPAAHLEDSSPSDSLSEEETAVKQPSRKKRRAGARRLTCTNCSTHQTPQWRCGPQGPRTLCNACGVRYKKGLPMEGIIAAAAAAAAGQH